MIHLHSVSEHKRRYMIRNYTQILKNLRNAIVGFFGLRNEFVIVQGNKKRNTQMPCPSMWPKQFWLVQNGFGWSKMVLVWQNWFGLDHNDLATTKMKWSRPKWIGQVKMWFILVENHNLDLTNSFLLWPFHFGRDQIIIVKSKSIWSDQNHFGPTKTVFVT
jgi:hypothetical protein